MLYTQNQYYIVCQLYLNKESLYLYYYYTNNMKCSNLW